MSSFQLGFIAFTFCAPPLLWLVSRKVRSPRLARGVSLTLAVALLLSYGGALVLKALSPEGAEWETTLPMHLCDWAAVATLLALVQRWAMAFELAYCWGLAGTAQALFTPAIEINDNPAVWTFFLVHSIIPASVLWLTFEFRMRPRRGAYWRVMLWSEVYLVAALVANRFSGGNYGFLDARPANPSLLDFYSDTWWIYVFQINLTAALVFAVLLLPWIRKRRPDSAGISAEPRPTHGH